MRKRTEQPVPLAGQILTLLKDCLYSKQNGVKSNDEDEVKEDTRDDAFIQRTSAFVMYNIPDVSVFYYYTYQQLQDELIV
jgi:hypothetical protein